MSIIDVINNNHVEYFPITGILLNTRTKNQDKIKTKIDITIIVRQISMPEGKDLQKMVLCKT